MTTKDPADIGPEGVIAIRQNNNLGSTVPFDSGGAVTAPAPAATNDGIDEYADTTDIDQDQQEYENAVPKPLTPNDLWDKRDELKHIKQCAEERNVSEWAVLGTSLCRALTATGIGLQLPPMIGGAASLNLFVALCGQSGAGKGASVAVATEAFDFRCNGEFSIDIPVIGSGTGEGIAATFNPPQSKDNSDEEIAPTRLMVEESEVTNLGALGGRAGSTLFSTLLKLWAGERVEFTNAVAKRPPLAKHSYRLTMTVQVQPAHAEVLMAHRGRGLPQRFLFLPTQLETADDNDDNSFTAAITPMKVEVGAFNDQTFIDVPEEVSKFIIGDYKARARRDFLDEDQDDTSGHRNLLRLKVAAALAILAGRATEMTVDDWALSALIMAKHDEMLAKLQLKADLDRRKKNKGRAESDAEVDQYREEADARRHDEKFNREVNRIMTAINQSTGRVVNRSALRSRLKAGAAREAFDDAVAYLEGVGSVRQDPETPGSRKMMIYAGDNWENHYHQWVTA